MHVIGTILTSCHSFCARLNKCMVLSWRSFNTNPTQDNTTLLNIQHPRHPPSLCLHPSQASTSAWAQEINHLTIFSPHVFSLTWGSPYRADGIPILIRPPGHINFTNEDTLATSPQHPFLDVPCHMTYRIHLGGYDEITALQVNHGKYKASNPNY